MRAWIFCGSEETLTAEHLFGEWISSTLYPSKKKMGLFHRNLQGRERTWRSTSVDYTARLLCPVCNNEWFGDLEQHVKPILQPMMLRGQRTVLGIEDQIALSAWIVKTMIVYNHMWDSRNPDHLFYSAEQRKQFGDSLELCIAGRGRPRRLG